MVDPLAVWPRSRSAAMFATRHFVRCRERMRMNG